MSQPTKQNHAAAPKRSPKKSASWVSKVGAASGYGLLVLMIFNGASWWEMGFKGFERQCETRMQASLTQIAMLTPLFYALFESLTQVADVRWTQAETTAVSDLKTVSTPLNQFNGGFLQSDKKSASNKTSHTSFTQSLWQRGKKGLKNVGVFVRLSLYEWALKLYLLMTKSILLIMASLIGALEGLHLRYVRTQEGGRESTLLYHHAGEKLLIVPVVALMIYLGAPLSFSALWMSLCLCVFFFLYFKVRLSCLKKYI